MATRQTFTGLQTPDDSQFDPAGVFDMSMFAQPATPMSGGTQGFAPTSNGLDLYDPTQTYDMGNDAGGFGSDPNSGLPPGAMTAAATEQGTDPTAPPPATAPPPTDTATATDTGEPEFDPALAASELASEYSSALKRNARPDEIQQYIEAIKKYGWPAVKAQIDSSPEAQAAAGRRDSEDSGLGDAVSGGLRSIIGSGGTTPGQDSLLRYINTIIAGGGRLPQDEGIEQSQLEGAREAESNAFTSQLNDARDELAARGLVSEPGIPQGAEGEAISEISRRLAPSYSSAVRDIKTNQQQLEESRLQSAISTATGITGAGAQQLLASLGQGTQRQIGLAQIALDSLGQDLQWNEFLANYGLQRDQILAQIKAGNSNSLMALIQLFLTYAGISGQGHI